MQSWSPSCRTGRVRLNGDTLKTPAIYSPPLRVDRIWLRVYYNKIPTYPIFYLDYSYNFQGIGAQGQAEFLVSTVGIMATILVFDSLLTAPEVQKQPLGCPKRLGCRV